MRDRIDPNDPEAVAWLQLALARLLPQPRPMFIGELDYMTWKAIQVYQEIHGLTPTPMPERERTDQRQFSSGPLRTQRPVSRIVPRREEQDAVLAPLLAHIQQQLRARNLTIS